MRPSITLLCQPFQLGHHLARFWPYDCMYHYRDQAYDNRLHTGKVDRILIDSEYGQQINLELLAWGNV